jgi:hypothetical protein
MLAKATEVVGNKNLQLAMQQQWQHQRREQMYQLWAQSEKPRNLTAFPQKV